MSGGSWGYLFERDGQHHEYWAAAERLMQLGDPEAARLAASAATLLRVAELLTVAISQPLHDMEWVDSADYAPEHVGWAAAKRRSPLFQLTPNALVALDVLESLVAAGNGPNSHEVDKKESRHG